MSEPPPGVALPDTRQHPVYLVIGTAKTLSQAIPYLVVAIFGGAPWWVNAALFGLVMVIAVAQWNVKKYSVVGGVLLLRGRRRLRRRAGRDRAVGPAVADSGAGVGQQPRGEGSVDHDAWRAGHLPGQRAVGAARSSTRTTGGRWTSTTDQPCWPAGPTTGRQQAAGHARRAAPSSGPAGAVHRLRRCHRVGSRGGARARVRPRWRNRRSRPACQWDWPRWADGATPRSSCPPAAGTT